MSNTPEHPWFFRLGSATILGLFLLIFIGATVRATGSGMGCPDWPTCFGHIVPPTHVSQLPVNYHEIYAEHGYARNDFDPIKTWIEYFNRLAGVSIGLMVICTLIAAWRLRRIDPVITYCCFGVLLMVGTQGWLGATVVASNLKPLIISLHMFLALALTGLLIYAVTRSQRSRLRQADWSKLTASYPLVMTIIVALLFIQILLGSQVREAVDSIAQQYSDIPRSQWREYFPIIFYIHRSFSAVILFSIIWLSWNARSLALQSSFAKVIGLFMLAIVVLEILLGITMDRFGIPAFAQPLHLLGASLLLGGLLCCRFAIHFGTQTQILEQAKQD